MYKARSVHGLTLEPLEERQLMTASTFAQDVVADGAVAFWPLNDAITSQGATTVSLVNPGTYNGTYQSGNQTGDGVTSGPAAYAALGTAAYFHNTTTNTSLAASDAVITPNIGLPTGTDDRTVLFWAKDNITSADSSYHAATEYGSPGTLTSGLGTFVFASGDSNSPTGGMGVSPWGGGTGTTTAFTDGQWHFFAVTISGGASTPSYSVYADGVLQNSAAISTSTILGLANTIGSSASVDGSNIVGWNGGLSDIAVFGSALSSDQVAQLYSDASNSAALSVTSSHSNQFRQGDAAAAGDSYTLAVTNSGNVATSGTVTLVDTLPSGLSVISASGDGWTTSISSQTITATRTDALAAGATYPVLTIAVAVAGAAPASVINSGTVSGGGLIASTGVFTDTTTISHLPSTFSNDVIADGALAFWPLNEVNTQNGATAASLVNPSTYNGTYQSGNQTGDGITSGPAAYPALGTAAYFHNTTANTSLAASDAVITPNIGLPTGTADRTVLFWAKDNDRSADSYYHAATEYGSPGTFTSGLGTFVFAGGDSNSPTGGMGVSPWGGGTGTTTAFTDGQWHFFAVTISGGTSAPTYSVYADGVLQNSAAISTSTILGLANTIGSSASVDGSGIVGWNGGLSDVAIFGSALSSTQIADLYADAPNSAGLTVSTSQSTAFRQGDTNDQYILTVSNTTGQNTSGTITLTDTLPTGLTPTAAAGSGWTVSISGQTVTASRSDALARGTSLPALSISVSVAPDAPATVTNSGVVSNVGGGIVDSSFSYATTIERQVTTFSQDVVADGALAFWPLNDANTSNGATTVSLVNPSTYNGTYQSGDQTGDGVTSGPAAYAALGTAAYFHNTSANTSLAASDAVITSNVGLPTGTDDRTVLFWAKDNNTSADSLYHAATEYGSPGTLTSSLGTFVFAGGDSNSPTGGMAVSQWGGGTGTTTAFTDGQWHFFAVTVSGGTSTPTYKVYADGALQNSKAITTNTILGLANTIGSSASVDGSGIVGWNGGLSDVAIFGSALSSTQIANLYADAPNGAALSVHTSTASALRRGDTSDQYLLTVSNTGTQNTSGTITLSDTLASGLAPTAASGSGWTASISGQTIVATYSGTLAAGQSLPSLIVSVNVASNAATNIISSGTLVSNDGTTPTATFSDNLMVLAPPRSLAQDIVADGALAFWPLNDVSTANGATAASLTNPGTYNGVYQNNVTSGPAAFAALGTAAYFHNTTANSSLASSDAVITPNTGLPSGSADRTITFWALDNNTTTDDQYHAVTEYGTPGTGSASFGTFVFKTSDSNSPAGGLAVSQWGDGTGTTSPVTGGQWHFFAVTLSGGGSQSNYRVYTDGVLQGSKNMTTNTILGLANEIGASSVVDGSNYVGWNGGLGDVAIFGSALSANEISQLYADSPNNPLAPSTIPNIAVNEGATPTTINLSQYFSNFSSAFGALSYSVPNDNQTLLAPVVNGSQLTLYYFSQAYGTANITVTATASNGMTASKTFPVTLNYVNQPPQFVVGTSSIVDENAGPQNLPGWATLIAAGQPSEADQALSFEVISDNPALFSTAPSLTTDGTLTYTPAAGQSGVAHVTMRLHDDGGAANGGHDTSLPQVSTIVVNPVQSAVVVDRQVFYDDSYFDSRSAGPDANDDNAIAPNKIALLPGQTASFVNYTSYVNGLNGVVVDILGLTGTPTAADFDFRTGNDSNPLNWAAAPAPTSVTVVPGGGVGGSDRIKLIWDSSDAVKNSWLRIEVKATDNTGLTRPDVFYFGNAIGESGNSTTDANVDEIDQFAIVNYLNVPGNFGVIHTNPIISPYDNNRDHLVSPLDVAIVNVNISLHEAPLELITPRAVAISGTTLATVGEPYTLSLATLDNFSGTITAWTVNWGDGTSDTLDGDALTASHTYSDGPVAGATAYSITASAATSDGGSYSTAPVAVTVNPSPVVLTATGASANEAGSVYTLALQATDIDPLTGWTISWGDGTSGTLAGDATSATHVFSSPTSTTNFTITASATDRNGSYSSDPLQVAISPSSGPTTLGISGSSAAVVGIPYTLNLSQTAGEAVTSWTINWGDGNSTTVSGGSTSAQYTYGSGASQGVSNNTITATGVNSHGTFNASDSVAVTVRPVAPTFTISGNSTTALGSTYTLNLSTSETAGETISGWTINWGDGTAPQAVSGNPSSVGHVFGPGTAVTQNPHVISATVTDQDGSHAANTQSVAVNSTPPTAAITGQNSVKQGAAYSLNLSATETDGDTITGWTINWDDGSSPQAIVGNPSSITHAYLVLSTFASKDFVVSATATDQDGTYSAGSQNLTVNPVNQAPSFTAGPDETIVNDGQAQTLAGWATLISAGPSDESSQSLTFNVTAADPALFSVQPTIDPLTGNLNFTPAVGVSGATAVTITLHDNGGTANGGSDTSASQTFNIALVSALNPTISGPATIDEGDSYSLNLAAAGPVNGWTINWGDGTTDALDGNLANASHVYGDGPIAGPNSYSITAAAIISQGSFSAAATVEVSVFPAPVTATAAGLSTNEAGSIYTLVLQATDIDTVTGWTINWGDGTTSTAAGDATAATHVFSSPVEATHYTMFGTATDFNGSYVTNPVQVVVSPATGPTTLAIAGSSTAVEESTYTLALSQSAGQAVTGWTIHWGDNVSTTVAGSATAAQHTYGPEANPGLTNYTITATGSNTHGMFSAANSVAVTVSPAAPTVTIGGNSSVEAGQVYSLTLSAANADGDSVISGWAINWGDGSTGTLSDNPVSASHVYAGGTPASYTITATATDEIGTYSSNSQAVTVAPATTVLAASGSSTAVEGSAYTLNLSQTSGASVTGWTINWGDGNTTSVGPTATSAQYAYSGIPAGGKAFTVTAVGTNSSGLYQSNAVTVTVAPASPAISVSGAASIDGGAVYTLNLSAVEYQGHVISQWNIQWGDGSPVTSVTSGMSSVSHVFQNPTATSSFTITATATDDTGTHASNTLAVTVARASTVLAVSGAASIGAGAQYTLALTQSGTVALTGWTINWGDGTTDTLPGTATSAQHTFGKGTAAGSAEYQVSATGSNANVTYSASALSVAVTPVAPTLAISGPSAIEGTGVYSLGLSAAETDGNPLIGWTITWGDGTTSSVAANASSASHVYADTTSAISHTISGTASDQDGSYSSNSQNVTVSPASTKITISGGSSATEGAAYSLTLSQSQGPAATSWTIKWGDGTSSTASGTATSAAHTFMKNVGGGVANYTVTATATNSAGIFAAPASVAVAVSPATPTLLISGAASATDGAVYTLGLSAIEPGGQAISSWAVNWGDGTASTLQGNPSTASHVFVTNPPGQATSYSITASGTDVNGSHAGNMLGLTVDPVATVFSISGAATANAGDDYTIDLTHVSGSLPLSWTINWGDGTTTTLLGSQTEAHHVYPEANSTNYTVSATVATSAANLSAGSLVVAVSPQDPLPIINGDPSIDDGATYSLALTSYPAAGDSIQSWTINWGDGSTPQSISGNPSTASHTFPIGANTYAITATAADLFGSDWNAGEVDVEVTNNGPHATAAQHSPVTINEDAADQAVLDLTTLFQDLEFPLNELTYSVVKNSDSSTLASATVNSNHQLVVSGVSNMYGMSEVTIGATDPTGKTAYSVVPVVVAPVNQAPTIVSAIPSQTVTSGTRFTSVDLWNYFTDREDGPYLTYSIASNSNPGVLSYASIDANGFLNLESNQSSGTTTMTIMATDRGGLSVTSAPFTVTAASNTPLPFVSVIQTAATTLGSDQPGWFLFQRSGGDLSQSLTVHFAYDPYFNGGGSLPTSITFAAGASTYEYDVPSSVGNAVILFITGNGSSYRCDPNASYQVAEWGPAVGPGSYGNFPAQLVEADIAHNADTSGSNPGWVRFVRSSDNIHQSLTVYYTYSGSTDVLIDGQSPPAGGTYGSFTFAPNEGAATLYCTAPTLTSGTATAQFQLVADPNPVGGQAHYSLNPNSYGAYNTACTISFAPSVTLDLALLGIDHATQQSPGAYLPIDNSSDAGLTGAVSTTTDGVTYQAPGQIADNGLDRNLRAVIPNLLPNQNVNDLWAARLTISNPTNSSPPVAGTLTWNIPAGAKVWWNIDNGVVVDRWVQVPASALVTEGSTFNVYIQATALGGGQLTATFTPNGATAVTDSATINVFGIDVTIASSDANSTTLGSLPTIFVDSNYYLGYANASGKFIPDDALSDYPLGSDPNLAMATVTPQGTIAPGSLYTLTVPSGLRLWNIATHTLITTGQTFPATQSLHVLVQGLAPASAVTLLAVLDDPGRDAKKKAVAAIKQVNAPITTELSYLATYENQQLLPSNLDRFIKISATNLDPSLKYTWMQFFNTSASYKDANGKSIDLKGTYDQDLFNGLNTFTLDDENIDTVFKDNASLGWIYSQQKRTADLKTMFLIDSPTVAAKSQFLREQFISLAKNANNNVRPDITVIDVYTAYLVQFNANGRPTVLGSRTWETSSIIKAHGQDKSDYIHRADKTPVKFDGTLLLKAHDEILQKYFTIWKQN